MNICRKFLILALCSILVASNLPVSARASAFPSDASMIIAGIPVIENGKVVSSTGEFRGGSFQYEEDTNTLFLKNFGSAMTEDESGGYLEFSGIKNLTISLSGRNRIQAVDSISHLSCISFTPSLAEPDVGTLTILGNGLLTLVTTRRAALDNTYTALSVTGNLILSNTHLQIDGSTSGLAEAPIYGILTTGQMTAFSSYLTVNETNPDGEYFGDSYGIQAGNSCVFSNTVASITGRSCALYLPAGSLLAQKKSSVWLTSGSCALICQTGNLQARSSHIRCLVTDAYETDPAAVRMNGGKISADASSSLEIWSNGSGTAIEQIDPAKQTSYSISSKLKISAGMGKSTALVLSSMKDYSALNRYFSAAGTPKTPLKLSVSAISSGSVSLSFQLVGGASEYRISYRIKGGSWKKKSLVSASSQITGLKAGRTYEFRIQSRNPLGYSSWSSIRTVTLPDK